MRTLAIDDEAWCELTNLKNRTFDPLGGFLTQAEYRSVVEESCLPGGEPWTIPITLEVPAQEADRLVTGTTLVLTNGAQEAVGELVVHDVFEVSPGDLERVFGVDDPAHPGVAKESRRSPVRVGGAVEVRKPWPGGEGDDCYISPAETRSYFESMGWRTVIGFQTRNPPHLAHEFLHRVGLEVGDGLFLQPLVGWKKVGDFVPAAVLGGYKILVDQFYPPDRVLLGSLRTPMRYAGPREAVFHALIRRNHGCTHFIVGRDHAGVGGYYGLYEAQDLARSTPNLGIEVLALSGPYYCHRCSQVVTERSCRHGKDGALEVSGQEVRRILAGGQVLPSTVMRSEVSAYLRSMGDKCMFGENHEL